MEEAGGGCLAVPLVEAGVVDGGVVVVEVAAPPGGGTPIPKPPNAL